MDRPAPRRPKKPAPERSGNGLEAFRGRQLEQLLHEMPVLLDAFDARGHFVFWNRECERVTGYTSREILNNPDALPLLYPDPVYLADQLARCQDRGPVQVWTLRARNGESRSIVWTDVPADPANPEQWIWGFGLDITERTRLEAALEDVSERERRRFGQELHDGLGQTLTGLALMVHSLAGRPEFRADPIAAELGQLTDLASGAIKVCREMATGLVPVEDQGLSAALQSLVQELQLEAPGVRIHFEDRSQASPRISATARRHLYRIAQEALNDALRHAEASRIRLVCRATSRCVTLLVQDNGRARSDEAAGQLGLRSLRDRAAAVDARLVVGPLPRGGTEVRVECPNHGVSAAR